MSSNDCKRAYSEAQQTMPCLDIILSRNSNEAQGGAQGGGAFAMKQIKQLKELLDMGAVTEEEFEAKKKELLEL